MDLAKEYRDPAIARANEIRRTIDHEENIEDEEAEDDDG
jgi:hypothetical protein